MGWIFVDRLWRKFSVISIMPPHEKNPLGCVAMVMALVGAIYSFICSLPVRSHSVSHASQCPQSGTFSNDIDTSFYLGHFGVISLTNFSTRNYFKVLSPLILFRIKSPMRPSGADNSKIGGLAGCTDFLNCLHYIPNIMALSPKGLNLPI